MDTEIRISLSGRVRSFPVFGRGGRKPKDKEKTPLENSEPSETGENQTLTEDNELECTQKKPNQYMKGVQFSSKKKRQLMNVCYYLHYQKAKLKGSKLLFYTFTIPSFLDGRKYNPQTDDRIFAKLFSKLLENLKRNYGLNSYIWVAERQKKSEKIHFHCLFIQDKQQFLNVQSVRLYWLWLCASVGCKFAKDNAYDLLEEYPFHRITLENYRKTGDYKSLKKLVPYPFKVSMDSPLFTQKVLFAPVDVKEVRNIKSLSSYLSKYLTKNDSLFYCRTNGFTQDLNKLKLETTISYQELAEMEHLSVFFKEYQIEVKGQAHHCFTMVLDPEKLREQFPELIKYLTSKIDD